LILLGSNHILKDKILSIQTEKPLLVLQEVASEVTINSRLGPTKTPQNKGEINKLYSQSLLMSWIMNQVRTSFQESANPALFEIALTW